MTQWIDQPGPDDDPVVRVEDQLGDDGSGEQRRPGGVQDVHADATRDRELYTDDEVVDDDVAGGLPGNEPTDRDAGEPAKRHGDPLVPQERDERG